MLALIVGVLTVVTAPSVAGGQTDDTDTTTDTTTDSDTTTEPPVTPLRAGALTLLDQSHYVAADGDFVAILGWNGPVDPDLTVTVTIRGKVSSESQLAADTAVLNRRPAVPLITVRQPDGSLRVDLAVRSFSQTSDEDRERVLIPDPGVYPVVIEVRDNGGTVASIRTYLVRLPTETAEIDLLPISTILPVSSADGLSVTDVVTLLDRHPTLPITVMLETGVVSELLDDPAAADALRVALAERTLIVGSTLDLDPSALAEIGQGQLFQESVRSSREVLQDLGLDPSESTLPIEPPLTEEGAQLLRSLGFTTVLTSDGGPSGLIDTPAGAVRVAGTDEELTSLLASRTEAVSAAHSLIARLALRAETDITPVLIGGPSLRQASLASIDVLLNAQEGGGLLAPNSLADFSRLSPPLAIRTVENPAQDLAPVADLVAESLGLIDSYRSFHASGTSAPDVFVNGLFAALGRDRNPTDRELAIRQVDNQLQASFDVIRIREGQSMTLTARRLVVPLSIENVSSGDRLVQLRFTADKVVVEEDGQTFLIPPGLTTLDITVEARALGLSPLQVEAFTPDGSRSLAATRLQIRSTAVPGLGLLLSGAALAFLISWWIISIGRTRALKHDAARAAHADVEPTLPERLDVGDAVVGVNVDADGTSQTI